jgi:multidrug efflux pump subunit AcrA (membrane-fusion protein)
MNRRRIFLIVLVAAIVGGTALYATWFRHEDVLQGSGTVEARNIRVGSKVGGRIDQVLVREGDRVRPGQVLVTI